ncbi:Serine/threonine-protein phosphatase PP2A catalytic subunit 3 [Tritrichomonas foetus]|uniref:Serine/threonine-protein phosphatase n=1 Tax=Tritrichomonas foetus TaxID=1144522 RepID=A0A1J4K5D2_9EUKA|nr:Serine/threonine-protein phosphatase PP2A catalytic subunit 3 [Tritrichomonas foetus]|eukprot:OHT06080.1 Serine/threonine-protein phosphatase PP2A catalytic subunit 3 [Tritrichomonas foetus]
MIISMMGMLTGVGQFNFTLKKLILKMDLDDLISRIKNGLSITPTDIDSLCLLAIDVLQNEENVIRINSPLTVCGDVHGDFDNVLSIFEIFGDAPDGRYLFLGDYVDRGDKSVETAAYLLALKVKYPNDFYLIRGNHESTHPTITFGFYNEVMNKFGDFGVWRSFMEAFKCLPLAAVIDSQIFSVHGGLCPSFSDISQLEVVNRFTELPMSGIILDVLWSDPFEGQGYQTSPRQAGYRWGADVSAKFTRHNKLLCIVRGHEQKNGGFHITHDDLVITVFSTPFYTKLYSEAAVMEVSSPTERQLTRFRPHQWEDDLTGMLFSNPWNQL